MSDVFIPTLADLKAELLHRSMAADAMPAKPLTQREREYQRGRAKAFDEARWLLQQYERTQAAASATGNDLSNY